MFRRRLIDNFLVELRVGQNTYSSMTLYRELKDDFHLADYLKTLDNKKHRNAIPKLRMSSHRLAIKKVDIMILQGKIENVYFVLQMILRTSTTLF